MKNILVAVDFSEGNGLLVQQAIGLAKELDGKLYVVHVTSDALQASFISSQFYDASPELTGAPFGDVEMARNLCADEYKREHRGLLNISARMREAGVEAQSMLLKGDAAQLILEKAHELKADIIMMGSHGHGLLRKMLVGSVAEAVLRKAPCNVMIVPVLEAAPVL
jgi:nucleotide-binding universal stress UspA family protein